MQKPIHTFCEMPFRRLKIDPEGGVTMSCFQQPKCLGNILEKGVEGIWTSELANEVRQYTLDNRLHPTCSNGGNCPYLHRQDQLSRLRKKSFLRLLPDVLELDLPNQHCNIGGTNPGGNHPACIMCTRNKNFFPQEDRLNEICNLLRPYMQNFKQIHIQGVAEPFWKDRMFELLDMLGFWDHAENIRLTTFTNGTILNDKRIKLLMKAPLHTLTFSIDAATAKTYQKIRRIDAFPKVVENLMKCSKLRRRGKQHLQIHNNLNMINLAEARAMVLLAASAKVSYMDFNPTYNTPGICVDNSNAWLFWQAEKEIIKTAKERRITAAFLRNLTLDFDVSQSIPLL